MSNDYPVSWEEMHNDSKALAEKLKQLGPFKGIVAVTKGGLIPACIVATDLDIKLVETIGVSSYGYQTRSELKILKKPNDTGDGDGWLVIDELADTGNTFRSIREILPKAHYACVYAKPLSLETIDTYIVDVPQDSWIYKPWEDETFPPHVRAKIGKHLKQ